MPFDIEIRDFHDKAERIVRLWENDYGFIMDKLETREGFTLLKESLSDYYGDYEIYLNQLEALKSEVETFNTLFESSFPSTVTEFVSGFLSLINQAIETRRTIKFSGD